MLAWAVWDTCSAGVSAVVVTFVFSVYLTGDRRQGPARRCSPGELVGLRAGDCRVDHRRAGPGDRCVGRGSTATSRHPDRADRPGGGVGQRDEPHPRPSRVSVSGTGVARNRRRAAIWPASPTTRCCDNSRRRRTPAGSPASDWPRRSSAASAYCCSSISAASTARSYPRIPDDPSARHERPDRNVVRPPAGWRCSRRRCC